MEGENISSELSFSGFDAKWYESFYPDVILTNLDPFEHYRKYGRILNRLINALEFEIRKDMNAKGEVIVERDDLVKQAFGITELAVDDYAIRLIEENGTLAQQKAKYIFKANKNISNKSVWLSNVNRYLSEIDVDFIDLDFKRKFIFDGLKSVSNRKKNTGPLVSVIMPAFNAEETILNAMMSILNQSWMNLELIVIDDNSTDKTADYISEIVNKDKRVRFVKNRKNFGPYVSKNYALTIAKGEFITGHDADDWAHPKRIESQVEYMMKNKSVKASIGMKMRIDRNGKFTHFVKAKNDFDDGVLSPAFISCIFESKFLKEKLGFWDSVRFGADGEIINRAKLILGDNFHDTNILTMFCLDSDTSLTRSPIHGISKTSGLSRPRKKYLINYKKWHHDVLVDHLKLNFPMTERPFDIEEESRATDVNLKDFVLYI